MSFGIGRTNETYPREAEILIKESLQALEIELEQTVHQTTAPSLRQIQLVKQSNVIK